MECPFKAEGCNQHHPLVNLAVSTLTHEEWEDVEEEEVTVEISAERYEIM